jgi:prepilin-type N-terminal cleavage/methylation domain-containing protein
MKNNSVNSLKDFPLPEGESQGEGEPRSMTRRRVISCDGFTMIEIALCLAIIGFALVAIIAVLPRGLDVEKKNREETIIGQDAQVWMDTIRSGAQGYDDLTNYVISITNTYGIYRNNGNSTVIPPLNVNATLTKSNYFWYTTSATIGSSFPGFWLSNGATIIGLLSTPKWEMLSSGAVTTYRSNYLVAYVRAFSGAEVTKVPQTNTTILGDAFIYRMIVENFPYVPVDTNSFCLNCPATNGLTPAQMSDRTNLQYAQEILQTNLHDLRLRFRYPVLPSGEIPSYGLATFRELASGQMTNYPYDLPQNYLYFIESPTFGQLTTTTPRPSPPL